MTRRSRFFFPSVLSFFIFASGSAFIVSAQQCTLKEDQLPEVSELFGFRLGMNFDQVKARVPLHEVNRAYDW